MKDQQIKDLWHKLTDYTYPYGHEEDVINIISENTWINLTKDYLGNYYTKIGESETLFLCHLDTVSKQRLKVNKIIYEEKGDEFVKTDGFTILGADDKTGVVIMLSMIENNIPGTYYFMLGEEVGYIGTNILRKEQSDEFSKYKRAISFDRKGYGSIIMRQKGQWCCSDEFVKALSSEFKKNGMKFKGDKFGVGTDSALFMGIISECTNLSVGYFDEHTYDERQNMDYMIRLCNTVTKINWESLPSVRPLESNDTEDPEEVTDGLPQYKLFHIFDDVEDYIYTETKSFAMNSESFKPNKEMRFAKVKDYNGVDNFSLYVSQYGDIKIVKDGKELSFGGTKDFKNRFNDFLNFTKLTSKNENLITSFKKFKY